MFGCVRLVACIGRIPTLPDLPPKEDRAGIFLAGDVTGRSERYIAPALADGTFAAAFALRHLGVR
jgi:thioredoxin reductase